VDRQPELRTLERLESRRGETWQGLWLAPLLTIVAQGFLLIALADENVGWLARAAVLAAALAASLAAAWSVLRAHAREVQYSEAIDGELAATAVGDYADVRAAALPRPKRRAAAPSATGPSPVEETPAEPTEDGEGETATLVADSDPTPPPPPTDKKPEREREGWVVRWDRHLVWWAAGETHAKSYMAWVATLGVFMLADVAVYLATV
jgi:hypothetical protein